MIHYLKGDATQPKAVIVHCCNNVGAWGAGFVLAISARWPEPEQRFYRMDRTLGAVDFVEINEHLIIANLIGQNGLGKGAVNYEAILDGLKKVNAYCIKHNATLHMPRMGCGLAGGSWPVVESIIKEAIDVECFVYDLL